MELSVRIINFTSTLSFGLRAHRRVSVRVARPNAFQNNVPGEVLSSSCHHGDALLTGRNYTQKRKHRHLSGELSYATALFDWGSASLASKTSQQDELESSALEQRQALSFASFLFYNALSANSGSPRDRSSETFCGTFY